MQPILYTLYPSSFVSWHLLFLSSILSVTYCCVPSVKREMLQKTRWERKRSSCRLCCHQVLALCIDVASVCLNIREAERWIIETLFVIKVKLKQRAHTRTHIHPGIHRYILCFTCEDLDLMVLFRNERKKNACCLSFVMKWLSHQDWHLSTKEISLFFVLKPSYIIGK